jgi:hypothetical protein
MGSPAPDASNFCRLPLKVGDHLWRPLSGGGAWHALFTGSFVLAANADAQQVLEVDSTLESVTTVKLVDNSAASTVVERLSLKDFIGDAKGVMVRSYTRRTHSRLDSVERALRHVGASVDMRVAQTFPEVLQWWAIFDESSLFNSGICAEQSRESRYKLTTLGDLPLPALVVHEVLAGGALKKKDKSSDELLENLRLSNEEAEKLRAAGFFKENFATTTDLLVPPSSQTVGSGLGGITGFAAVASLGGMESLTVLGGGVIVGSGIALGSLAALVVVGAAHATKKALANPGEDRTAEYHDCPFLRVKMHDYKFPLADNATERIDSKRFPAVFGWYVAHV